MHCRVYQATGPADAYLVRDWLERNNINTWVLGEALIGLHSAIPAGRSWPSVWVMRHDRERAELAVRDFHGPALVSPDWVCQCGETNAPTFGSCWRCGAEPN
jgi:hypothetical protein